jgi:ectoine hydroxylase-related dioxygenase (phytanoyl-CoA dioxygenase family)
MNWDVLKEPYPLSEKQIEFYKRNAYIKIKQLIPEECIRYFNGCISEKVAEMNTVLIPLEERDTYGKAFLQLFNLWREDPLIKELIFSPRLARVASELMEVEGVRLYHDQALFKEAGGGITPWHADQYYWPLSSDKTLTAWIPLQFTPLEMGPLEFSAGSHRIQKGRALSISDESEAYIGDHLRVSDFPHRIEPFDIGEISFHSGWIFHRAGANSTDHVRKVMTIIYMDKDMKLKAPENDGQQKDWATWCPGVEIGQTVNSHLNPILFKKSPLLKLF